MERKKVSALKRERVVRGLSQSDLSFATGIGQVLLSGYETGRRKITKRHKMILSRALGVPIKKLFPREDHDRILDR